MSVQSEKMPMLMCLSADDSDLDRKMLHRLYELSLAEVWQDVAQSILCANNHQTRIARDVVLAITGIDIDIALLMFLKVDTEGVQAMKGAVEEFLNTGHIPAVRDFSQDFYDYGCIETDEKVRLNAFKRHHVHDFYDIASAFWVWLMIGTNHSASLLFV